MKKQELRIAFVKTIPILFSYIFLGMAFGITMQQAGFAFYWSGLVSLIVYTGAFQFVLVPFLAAGTSLLTIALTALAMNSRHIFYGLSFIEDFRSMGKRFPYMVVSLTDETFALNSSTEFPPHMSKKNMMFYIAVLCQLYWVLGSVVGGILGAVIPFDFAGVDFCMTALFITIFIDQWRQASSHIPAIIGLVASLVFLLLLGADNFILPALLTATALLFVYGEQKSKNMDLKKENREEKQLEDGKKEEKRYE